MNETTYAEPRKTATGWYVFWETTSMYGARGRGLSKEAAEDLAERIRRDGPNVSNSV
jgi:kynurenine formamidase